MKRTFWLTMFAALGFAACSQPPRSKTPPSAAAGSNTLLWRISGKDLTKPSYLFGTMHMICASDIELSDSLRSAIKGADRVYLELDMDDMMGMLGAVTKMSMRDDTTLADLLTPDEYKKVKAYFDENAGILPFAMMERYKPMLIGSLIMEQSSRCENMIVMENLVMEAAKENDKEIKGLETIDYQLSIFDSIPYKMQAQQLLKMVESSGKDSSADDEMRVLTEAYRRQELNKMDELATKEEGIAQFTDLLLYNRNRDWAKKLPGLMAKGPLVIAVGAGHLPGDKGVINLLRKAGYKVEPVRNDMIRKKSKGI